MATRREEVRVTADVSSFTTRMALAGKAAGGFARDLEQADSRLANVVQTGLALGPALVPIAAVAVPAVAALTAQLGFATLAGGSLVLAFNGVGDSLGALNAYQLDPTAANLEKVREAMGNLGPAAQDFAVTLQNLRPEMQRLQDISAQGFFPGATEGLESVMTRLPELERMFFAISTTLGDLAAEAGGNLAGPEWQRFFDYLQTSARPTLEDMGRSFGNLIEGLANVVMAFDPLSRDFSAGMLDMSRSFADWSASLSSSAGFQEFVEYVQTNGPRVLDVLGSLASAFLEIVEAAAPVGSALLPVISAMADGLGAIADSPIGPVIIAAATAVGVLGRSMALLRTVGLLGGGTSLMSRMFAVDKIGAGVSAMTTVAASTDRARMSVTQFAAAERERNATMRAGAAQFGKNAALLGGLALATTGVAEKTGLSNTASLALMGTIAGPWGAAIGGAIGFTMDLAAANDEVQDAMRGMDQAVSSQAVDLAAQGSALTRLRATTDDYTESVRRAGGPGVKSFRDIFNAASDLFTNTKEESKDAVDQQLADLQRLRTGAAQLYASVNQGDRSLFGAPDAEIQDFITRVTPALQRAGISVREALSSPFAGAAAALAIARYNAELDSATGKSRSVADALNELDGVMLSNADAAGVLAGAMESLFGTELDQSEAIDAWHQSLADLRGGIRATTGDLVNGQSPALRENRALINDSVRSLQDRIAKDAAAGVSGGKLVRTLLEGREAIVKQGRAAGLAGPQVRRYLDSLNLTPKNLTTVIVASGVLSVTQKITALGRLYRLTPKEVRTLIKEAGTDRTKKKIEELAKKYDLMPKEVHALLSATDKASSKSRAAKKAAQDYAKDYQARLLAKDIATQVIRAVRRELTGLDRAHASPTISANTSPFHSAMGTVFAAIQRAANASANVNVGAREDGGLYENGHRVFADGGYGMDGRYYPRTPQIVNGGANILWGEKVTGWEAYISGKSGMRDRNLEIWRQAGDRLGARFVEYANGGLRNAQPVGATARTQTTLNIDGMTIEGRVTVVDPRTGEGYLRGVARQEANAAIDDAADFGSTLTRRNA